MIDQTVFDAAFKLAHAFVDKRRLEDGPTWAQLQVKPVSAADAAIFYWGGSIPLVEIPLFDVVSRQSSGYLLVSTSPDLPPMLEYATSGKPLSESIQQFLAPSLAKAGLHNAQQRFVFITSTEIYVELVDPSRNQSVLLNVPGLFSLPVTKLGEMAVTPNDVFDQQVVRRQWLDLKTPGGPGDLPEVVLQQACPIRYQQNCDGYAHYAECKLELDGAGTTYCSPHAIAGCAPVAWAMLLSSWKRTGLWNSSKIWPGVSRWDREWPSGGGDYNVSQCPEVEKTIWRIHALMGTTADGSTLGSRTIAGAAIFHEFGMEWTYAQAQGQSFEFAASIIAKGQPFLWTAAGPWHLRGRATGASPQPGSVGHAVVAYGYKKADRTLLVALGWGSAFPNKSITYDQYASSNCLYLTGSPHVAAARLPDGVEAPLDVAALVVAANN